MTCQDGGTGHTGSTTDDNDNGTNGPISSVPNAVNVRYVTNDKCTKKPYKFKKDEILDSHMCLVEHGKDSCYGDSGGPAVLVGENDSFVQVGIVSIFHYGSGGCAKPR